MSWISTLPRFLMFFFACALVLKEWIEVLARNAVKTSETVVYVLPDSVVFGAISLGIVGVSIFLKRNIWAYVFLLVVIASFFPAVSFTSFDVAIFFGSIKFDLITVPLLVCHVLLNIHLFKFPELSKTEVEESQEDQIESFIKRYESKSDEELVRMDENDLLPEASEARKRVLKKRGL